MEAKLASNSRLNCENPKVPVVLAIGCDTPYQLPPEFVRIPRITKPIGQLDLSSAIGKELSNCPETVSIFDTVGFARAPKMPQLREPPQLDPEPAVHPKQC